MKITSVELHSDNAYLPPIVLSFRDPKRLNAFNIKNIVGLDADEIIPRFYKSSGSSDKKFYNLSLEKRDIILLIELNPNFTYNQGYSELRDALYRYIASSRTGVIEIQFKDEDDIVASISGFVSKFEGPLFTKTPEIQMTVSCNDLLKAPIPIELNVSIFNPPAINFIDLRSTAPHGFQFQAVFLNPVSGFTMYDPSNMDWIFDVVPVGGFLQDDILAFSSELNNKYIYIIRGVTPIHLADVISPESVWPIQFPGDNVFGIGNFEDIQFLNVSYYPTYWGV